MQPGEAVDNAALSLKLFEIKEYMELVATIRFHYTQGDLRQNTQDTKGRAILLKNLKLWPLYKEKFGSLNKSTLNTLIDFALVIPEGTTFEKVRLPGNTGFEGFESKDFESPESIAIWLEKGIPEDKKNAMHQAFSEKLTEIEKRQETSDNWDNLASVLLVGSEVLTELAQVPILQIVAIPVMDGLWALWYASLVISAGYNPALGGKLEQAKSRFDKTSGLIGGIATAAAIVGLIFPPLLPICAPIAAIGLLASNVLWTAGTLVDFYKEIKGGETTGRNWRIASGASSVLYTLGSIVIAALAITALFTPVGWAAGAAAVAFGVGAASAVLGVFAISKFCQWRAKVAEKREKAAITQTQEISPELSAQLAALNAPKLGAKQTTEVHVDVNLTAQTAATHTPDISPIASATIQPSQGQHTSTLIAAPLVDSGNLSQAITTPRAQPTSQSQARQPKLPTPRKEEKTPLLHLLSLKKQKPATTSDESTQPLKPKSSSRRPSQS